MEKKTNTYPFNTPKNYFDSFEDRLFEKIKEEGLPKTSGLKVPETYFAEMEQRMLDVATKDESIKTIPLFPKKYFGYAAAIAACMAIGLTFFNQTDKSLTLENIKLSMIDKYIEDGNLNLNLYDLTDYMDDNEISRIDLQSINISDGVLENYLLENMEDDILMDEGLNQFE